MDPRMGFESRQEHGQLIKALHVVKLVKEIRMFTFPLSPVLSVEPPIRKSPDLRTVNGLLFTILCGNLGFGGWWLVGGLLVGCW